MMYHGHEDAQKYYSINNKIKYCSTLSKYWSNDNCKNVIFNQLPHTVVHFEINPQISDFAF